MSGAPRPFDMTRMPKYGSREIYEFRRHWTRLIVKITPREAA